MTWSSSGRSRKSEAGSGSRWRRQRGGRRAVASAGLDAGGARGLRRLGKPGDDAGDRDRDIGVDAPADPRDERRRRADRPAFATAAITHQRISSRRASWLHLAPLAAGLAVRAAADGNARAADAVPDSGARGQGPRPGHAAGTDLARFRLPGPRRPDRHRPGDHPVRDRARGGSARLADHEPGRRPGDRPGRPQRADRGPDPRQDHGRHRSPQRSPHRRPAGRRDRRRRRQNRRNAASRFSWARTSRASPWSSTWPRCPTS